MLYNQVPTGKKEDLNCGQKTETSPDEHRWQTASSDEQTWGTNAGVVVQKCC
jgi:hypothetical protein